MRGCACPALLLLLACVSRSGQSMTLRAGQNRLLVPSQRSDVASFKVMDVLKNAQQLEALGHPVLHLEVGQPSTSAPEIVKAAAAKALAEDKLGYTEAKGIMTLREAIVKHYEASENVPKGSLSTDRVLITTGSSGGLILAFCACFDAGDHVAIGSTCYPCYRNMLEAFDCNPVSIDLNPEFKLTAKELSQEIQRRRASGLPELKGIIQSSPSNPTGSTLTAAEMEELCSLCQEEGLWFLSDEIYHGISYGSPATSATRYPQYASNVLVMNSFSKYYSMTGWRLGWMIVPDALADSVYRLQQNMFINAPTLSQLAAVDCFKDESIAELESHVERYAKNREVILKTLGDLDIPTSPCTGAFYIYADLGELAGDASKGFGAEVLCQSLLEEKYVALTPGTDFEDPATGRGLERVRFSFPGTVEDIEEAMERLREWWPSWLRRIKP